MKFSRFNKPATNSRKQQRKQERRQKKQKKQQHFQKRKNSEQQEEPVKVKRIKKIEKPQKKEKYVDEQPENEDDRLIKMYEKKMGKTNGNRKLKKQLTSDGFDDDLLDFLDGIGKKVKDSGPDEQPEEQSPWEEGEGFVEQMDQEQADEQQPIQEEQEEQMQDQQPLNQQPSEEELTKIRKSINGLLNKVAQGNLAKIFKEMHQLFVCSPKSQVFLIFSQLFIKFNIDNPRALLHIQATHIALACALHQLHDNSFMAPLIKSIVDKFFQLLEQNLQEKKHIINILAYMYLFDSLTVSFIRPLIDQLLLTIDSSSIQLLYILIRIVGTKIRQDDPLTLKTIIENIKQKLQNPQQNLTKKAGYILQQLNEIRFNKKQTIDTRHQFLRTFIKQDILQKNNIQPKIFALDFDEIHEKDVTEDQWWEPNAKIETDNMENIDAELKSNKKYYEQLAKEQKMVTEFSKKVFVAIMTAEDYVDAAEKILEMRSKKHNEIAAVIVETCTQEKTFNPFYLHLLIKLLQLMPRFKIPVQFAIWNQEKQMQNYSLRKISNLAKLLSSLIIEIASLSMLKNLNDMVSVDQHQQIFLTIFWQHFFLHITNSRLVELMKKITEGDNNSMFRNILEQYLKNEYMPFAKKQNKPYIEKVKLAVRLLRIKDIGVQMRQ